MKQVVLCALLAFPLAVLGQSPVQVRTSAGLELPIYYTVGIQAEYRERYSLEFRAGYLTQPWDQSVLAILETDLIGLDPRLSAALENAFQQGYHLSLRPGYRWGIRRRHSVVLSVQYLHLSAADTGADALESATGRSLNRIRPGTTPLALTLQTDLWNLGLFYSYRLPVGTRWDLHLEAGLHRTLTMVNSLQSNRPNLDATRLVQQLYADLDTDLSDLFADYGYIPSLNVLVSYRLTH